ncbi:PEP/pyruvate-binding domain-containing protein [Wukongibacter sp. M2B1]|uniref:PEP/pyruvate-binding domain-containing protein n=1 Tax=Wukongibacter sp. M2B1 TaxID=3088895 RepID=UPI003D7A3143
MESYIQHLSNLVQDMHKEYGSKAVTLAELWQNGYNVPDGYSISSKAFDRFCGYNCVEFPDIDDIADKIISSAFPEDLEKEIEEMWREFDLKGNEALIIRSSAIGEDGYKHSFAGIYDSIINIRSIEDLKIGIRRCWSSFYSERAVSYRKTNNIAMEGMAILVQIMIDGDSSGVLFTLSPVAIENDEMAIEAYPGLNCVVVDGSVNADKYIVKRTGETIREIISHKTVKYCLSGSSFEMDVKNIKHECKNSTTLSQENISSLVEIGLKLEDRFGIPCDIEWTILNGQIYILQTRPVTANECCNSANVIKYDSDIPEDIECTLLDRYSQPACTCYLSMLQAWEDEVYLSFYNKQEGRMFKEKPLLFYFNRVYWNMKYQRDYFDDYLPDKYSVEGSIKNVKLFNLMLNSYKSWYRRLDKYDKHMDEMKGLPLKNMNISELGMLLNKIMNILCNFIGKDHFRFLGLAQISYNLLRKELSSSSDAKEIIAKAIEPMVSKNMTMKSNLELMELAKEVKNCTELKNLFKNVNANRIYSCLKGSIDKELFKEKFDEFIREHGHRGTSCDDLFHPHWEEEPSIVLEMIKQFIPCPTESQSKKNRRSNSKYNWDAVIEKLDYSPVYKLYKKWRIKTLVTLTGKYMALRENQRYYFDKSWVVMRKVLLEIGRRLAKEGIINEEDDIFHLAISEIHMICYTDNMMRYQNWKEIVRKRKKVYERNSQITPPYLIKNSELVRLQNGKARNSYKAVGISPGKATGSARIIESIKDLSKIQQGDIAIVSTFHPSWTPILGMVNGLVMDYGNILSHGAVMAREYGIPVVVFNGIASRVFLEGQWIEIDGTTGRIRVISQGVE